MRRFFVHLAYHGGLFCGWQRQQGVTTVQQTLEEALTTLLRTPTAVVGCGRTDSGVHASDFYAHFDYEPIAPQVDHTFDVETFCTQLCFKLNSFLPPSIRIYSVFEVAHNAHARFDALARTYEYHVSSRRLPFRQGLYCRIYFDPDIDAMNQAAAVLMDYDDFTSFAKLHTDVKTNICHLTEARWESRDEELVFRITSNRFLRNMVRSVTGTLLDEGRGRLTLDGLRAIVEAKNRSAAGVSMPPDGLFLTKVKYEFC